MSVWRKSVLTGLMVLAFGTDAAAGSIRGKVLDFESGEALPRATVIVLGEKHGTIAGDDGEFMLPGMLEGEYRIQISYVGYAPGVYDVHASGKQQPEALEFRLKPRPIIFEELEVMAQREPLHPRAIVTAGDMEDRIPKDIGEYLRAVPGVSALRKGGTGLDPVFRGFRGDQLNVQVDGGVKVCGACPNRMDPPTGHLQSEDLAQIEILSGPHAVRFGPSLGGVINLAMARPEQSEEFSLESSIIGGFEGPGNGKRSRVKVMGGDRRYDFYASAGVKDFGNYEDGRGERVLSSFDTKDYSLKAGLKPTPSQRMQISFRQSFTRDALYPALPMDLDKDDTTLLSGDYSLRMPARHLLRSLSAKAYVSLVDHSMSNSRKSNWQMVHAVTDAYVRTAGGRAEVALKLMGGTMHLGSDYADLLMEGDRTRDMMSGTMAGRHFDDIIWPDAYHRDLGFFVQGDVPLTWRSSLSIGMRLDRVNTGADRPEGSFVALMGENLHRTDTNVSASATISRSVTSYTRLSASLGMSSRSPSIPERYLYLLPVGLDAYDYLGDPDLEPERNTQMDVGAVYETMQTRLEATLFYSRLADHISAVITDITSPRSPNVLGVKVFENLPRADRYGVELTGRRQVLPVLQVSARAAYTRGEDTDRNEPLPEIPPLDGALSIRYAPISPASWVEFTGRLVARQDRASTAFGETPTPGFGVLDLTGSAQIGSHLKLRMGARNLLDKAYYEHLNRRQKVDGIPIYESGRTFFAVLTVES